MKSKILIFLMLLLSVRALPQAVPNTVTFTLQNVVDVVGGTSLQAAFTNAAGLSQSNWNSTYSGSKNSLLNFRDYKFATLASLTVNDLTDYAPENCSTYVVTGAIVSIPGGTTVTERGICWSNTNTTDPTRYGGNSSYAASGSGTGTFTATANIGSYNNYVYGIRMYAILSDGSVSYSPYILFQLNPGVINTDWVPAPTISDITRTTAYISGVFRNKSCANCVSRALNWATHSTPTYEDLAYTIPGDVGNYGTTIGSLTANTTYYIRVSHAWYNMGSYYSPTASFTTASNTAPIVASTSTVGNITSSSARSGGTINDDGGYTVTDRGLCWSSVTTAPTKSHSWASVGSGGTGTFAMDMTSGISPSTTYYVRAYATNSAGTSYDSSYKSFTSSAPPVYPPSVTTVFASQGYNYYSVGGNVTADNGATVTARGVFYGTSPSPGAGVTIGSGTGAFSGSTATLSPGTLYYYRAWAYNSAGYGYGSEYYFITPTAPTVTTTGVTFIAATTVTTGGNITASGGQTPNAAGVCYSTSSNPTTSNTTVSTSTYSGAFTSYLTGLTASTTYYVRAYATNYFGGTSYGPQISFTTTSGTINAALTIQVLLSDQYTMTLRHRVTTSSNVPSTQAFNIINSYSVSVVGPTTSTITISSGTNTQYFDYEYPRMGGWTLTTNWDGSAPSGYTYTTGAIYTNF